MDTPENSSPHLLVIDDNPDQLRLLVAALRSACYRVSVALDGDQGFARATVLQPRLILLDVCMPGRSGLTVARLLKTNPATQHIPIIFLSGMADTPDRLAGLKSGAVDYITKPFSPDEVLERVRIHLALSPLKAPPASGDSPALSATNDQVSPNPQAAAFSFKQMAVEFILSHIHEPTLRSSDVAASLGLSPQRLNTIFEEGDGLTVFEFIRQERMRRAALMLGQSMLPIAGVALEVGYANPANFATEFKKFWGKSPTQIRSEAQGDADAMQRLMVARLKPKRSSA